MSVREGIFAFGRAKINLNLCKLLITHGNFEVSSRVGSFNYDAGVTLITFVRFLLEEIA